MNDWEYRAFMDLLMCSDPWPIEDDPHSHMELVAFANREAAKRGYDSWIAAYHDFAPYVVKL